MRSPHLHYAHRLWKNIVCPGDCVIDATAGNGHDTLYLASLLNGQGKLSAYDIQSKALEQTAKQLEQLPPSLREIIELKLKCHSQFEEQEAKLIVYNLGYLPGGDKTCTTQTATTLLSLKNSLKLVAQEGAISITCYPGHEEGKKEQSALLDFLKELEDLARWEICHYQWLNRSLSPTLIWITPA